MPACRNGPGKVQPKISPRGLVPAEARPEGKNDEA